MLLNKKFAVLLTCASLSTLSFADEVKMSSVVLDNYWGATNSSEHSGGSSYDIFSMFAKKTRTDSGRTFLDVYFDTNFHTGVKSSIDYGDLLITTGASYNPNADTKLDATYTSSLPNFQNVTNEANRESYLSSATRWEYAFDIDSNNNNQSSNSGNGKLMQIDTASNKHYANSFYTANDYNSSVAGRDFQAVSVKNRDADNGSWDTDANDLQDITKGSSSNNTWVNNIGGGSSGTNRLAFSFEITGIDALVNANQLAFRWAMTCANDIMEGVANFKSDKPSVVPEPGMLALVMVGLAGLFMRKRKTQ